MTPLYIQYVLKGFVSIFGREAVTLWSSVVFTPRRLQAPRRFWRNGLLSLLGYWNEHVRIAIECDNWDWFQMKRITTSDLDSLFALGYCRGNLSRNETKDGVFVSNTKLGCRGRVAWVNWNSLTFFWFWRNDSLDRNSRSGLLYTVVVLFWGSSFGLMLLQLVQWSNYSIFHCSPPVSQKRLIHFCWNLPAMLVSFCYSLHSFWLLSRMLWTHNESLS